MGILFFIILIPVVRLFIRMYIEYTMLDDHRVKRMNRKRKAVQNKIRSDIKDYKEKFETVERDMVTAQKNLGRILKDTGTAGENIPATKSDMLAFQSRLRDRITLLEQQKRWLNNKIEELEKKG